MGLLRLEVFVSRIFTGVAAIVTAVVSLILARPWQLWLGEGSINAVFIVIASVSVIAALFLLRPTVFPRSRTKRRKFPKPRTGFFENTVNAASVNADFDFRSMRAFMGFLTTYNRTRVADVSRRFSPSQKKMLVDFFFLRIVPNTSVPIADKEEMRKFLNAKAKISELSFHPDYYVADADSRLINDETDKQAKAIKDSGNQGEKLVRSVLDKLNSEGKYEIHNGVQICLGFSVHEFDHIVCADGVVFMLETKAYTLNSGSSFNQAVVRIRDDGIIEATKFGNTKTHDPRNQITTDAELMAKIVGQSGARVVPVLVIANQKAKLINECADYPCEVLHPKDIAKYIENRKDTILNEISSKSVPTASDIWIKIRERTVSLRNFDKKSLSSA